MKSEIVLVIIQEDKAGNIEPIREHLPTRINGKGQRIVFYLDNWYLCCEYGNIGYEIIANDPAYLLLNRYSYQTIKTLNNLIKEFMKHDTCKEYHSSYNCLMPVIDTIETINLNIFKEVNNKMLGLDHYAHFDTAKDRASVWIAGNWIISNIMSIDNRLYNAYYCTIKFIKWYNNQTLEQ